MLWQANARKDRNHRELKAAFKEWGELQAPPARTPAPAPAPAPRWEPKARPAPVVVEKDGEKEGGDDDDSLDGLWAELGMDTPESDRTKPAAVSSPGPAYGRRGR